MYCFRVKVIRCSALIVTVGCLLVSACSSEEPGAGAEESDPDAATSAPQADAVPDDRAGSSEFCVAAISLEGERPETYVGSGQHIADVTRLAALAPEAISGQATAYRDFLDEGGVDRDDPESNVVANWPADIQAAVAEVREFIDGNC